MRFLGKFIKTLLRSVFSILLFLLLVGLAKMKWDVNGYISFLNTNDWSLFHLSQPATWADPFWPHQEVDVTIDDMLIDEDIESETGVLDVYDPSFEAELNALPDSTSLDEDEDFGFVADESHDSAPTNNSTIQQLMKQRN